MFPCIHKTKISRVNPFSPFLKPLCAHIPSLPKILTLALEMVTQSGSSKRSVCPSCSKPTRICLCTRFKSPKIQNSVAITILQHSLEKKHPLNSTRIASIGLTNVDIISVSDVNFQAEFSVRVVDPFSEISCRSIQEMIDFCEFQVSVLGSGCGQDCNFGGLKKYPIEKMGKFADFVSEDMGGNCMVNDNLGANFDCNLLENVSSAEKVDSFGGFAGKLSGKCDFDIGKRSENCLVSDGLRTPLYINLDEIDHLVRDNDVQMGCSNCGLDETIIDSKVPEPCVDAKEVVSGGSQEANFAFVIEKYGVISSFYCHSAVLHWQKKLKFEKLFDSGEVRDDLAKGFVVKKLQKKPLNGAFKYEEFQEFELGVPPGSVLLFPSEKAVGVEDIDFEVKNLIVLDGTWAKAKRMYSENPWLKALPHLKLDIDKLSLYGEVRHQPRAGFLSTIESIVYALKAVGDHSEELDSLLGVFDSMVRDQRRCKDERLSKSLHLSLD